MAEDRAEVSEGILTPELRGEFEQIIKSSGAEIIPAKKYDIPASYDLSKTPEKNSDLMDFAVKAFTDYLSFPIISDKFPDHEERRKWRKETYNKIKAEGGTEKADQFDDFLKENKMKRNKIAGLISLTDLLREDGLVTDELANKLIASSQPIMPNEKLEFRDIKKLKRQTNTYVDPWEGPTTPEKITVVEKIADNAAEILRYLGSPRS